jgi:hypothetical protein
MKKSAHQALIVNFAAALLLMVAPAHAGLEEGLAAYRNKDYATTLKEMLPLAKAGQARAQNVMGVLYQNGQGVPRDLAEALRWYKLAADQEESSALNNLGVLYSRGLGVQQDHAQAVKWFMRSSEAGNDLGTYNLAQKYEKGEGVHKNYTEALRHYRQAAQRGHAPSQVETGLFYEEGRDGDLDVAAARTWYQKAADKNNAEAHRRLGLLHERGLGVEKDIARARSHFEKALAQGAGMAKRDIARLDFHATLSKPGHLAALQPEELGALCFEAMRLNDWAGLVRLMSDEEVHKIAGMLVEIMAAETRSNKGVVRRYTFRQPVSQEAIRALAPRDLVETFMANFISPTNENKVRGKARVLGAVREGEDQAHVLARIMSGASAAGLEVLSLVRTPSGWGLKMQDVINDLAAMLVSMQGK